VADPRTPVWASALEFFEIVHLHPPGTGFAVKSPVILGLPWQGRARTLAAVATALVVSCGAGVSAQRQLVSVTGGPVQHGAMPVASAVPAPRIASHERRRLHLKAHPSTVGTELGDFQLTYYWVAEETEPGRGATLRDTSCRPIATVTPRFAHRVRLEGTGRLADGRLINAVRRCRCGGVCFAEADPEREAWGLGVRNRPLKPYRSIAVDPRRISIGTWVYVAELDGLHMPDAGGVGGFVHDGCLVADDRGGGVRGKQIDFFAALRANYRDLHGAHRLTRVTVHEDAGHCAKHQLFAQLLETKRG